VDQRGDGKTADPNYRLRYFVDPKTKLPVMLNRGYLISRLVDSGKELSSVETWGIGPWNWGNILLEIPRGVLGTPLELVLGRGPNQHHFIGRVHMQKIEGGATKHRVFPVADPGCAAWEQPFRIDHLQVFIVGAIGCHARDYADTQAHSNVGLDDVGIASREDDVGLQAFVLERAL